MGLSARGSTATPPLPPPKGRSASAHFQLIQIGERGDFADVDIGGEARAALGGTERQVMLDPVADEKLGPIVLHADRKVTTIARFG